jgi:hypothetical protein
MNVGVILYAVRKGFIVWAEGHSGPIARLGHYKSLSNKCINIRWPQIIYQC